MMKNLASTELSDYDLTETLGEGTFARIMKATYRPGGGGNASALKVIKKTLSPKDLKVVSAEADTMARLSHENVLKLLGPVTRADGSLAALNLELASDDDFFSLVEKGGKMSDALTRHYFRQMMLALKHCHSRGIAHRDVKLENLLLGEGFRLKLSDFGLAWASNAELGVPPPHMYCKTRTGTIPYMAPELLLGNGTIHGQSFDTSKLDVWSAGVTLFILITGFPPWAEATSKDKFYRLTPRMDTFWRCVQRWAVFTDDAISLLTAMLDKNPATRLSVDDVLAHPYCNPASPLTDENVAAMMTERGHKCPPAVVGKRCGASQGSDQLETNVKAAEAAPVLLLDSIDRFGSAGPSSATSTPAATAASVVLPAPTLSVPPPAGPEEKEVQKKDTLASAQLPGEVVNTDHNQVLTILEKLADITMSNIQPSTTSKRQNSLPQLPTTRSTTPISVRKRPCSTSDNKTSEDQHESLKPEPPAETMGITNEPACEKKPEQPSKRLTARRRVFPWSPHEQALT